MRISDWSSDVCSSDLSRDHADAGEPEAIGPADPLTQIADEDRAERGADVDAHVEDRIGRVAAQIGQAIELADHHRDIGLQKTRADDDERECEPEDVDRRIGLFHRRIGDALVALERHERSEEHTSELQSLMRISYAVFCLKKKTKHE